MRGPQETKRKGADPARFGLLLAVLAGLAATATASEIDGKTLDAKNNVIAGAEVSVFSPDGDELDVRATSDKKGRFNLRIPDAAPSVVVHIEAEGHVATDTTVELEGGKRLDMTFHLLDRKTAAALAFNEGGKAFATNDLGAAREKFSEAAELDPGLVQAHMALADVLARQGSLEAAARSIDRYLAARPDDEAGSLLAFRVHQRLGHLDRVRELAPTVKSSGKAGPIARAAVEDGLRQAGAGELDAAIVSLRAALALEPENREAAANLGAVLLQSGKAEAALEAVAPLLEAEGSHAQGLRVRCLALRELGRKDELRQALAQYLEADQRGALELLEAQAEDELREGRIKEAVSMLEQVVTRDPGMASAHYALGLALAGSERGKSKEHLRKFLELAPDSENAADARRMLEEK